MHEELFWAFLYLSASDNYFHLASSLVSHFTNCAKYGELVLLSTVSVFLGSSQSLRNPRSSSFDRCVSCVAQQHVMIEKWTNTKRDMSTTNSMAHKTRYYTVRTYLPYHIMHNICILFSQVNNGMLNTLIM